MTETEKTLNAFVFTDEEAQHIANLIIALTSYEMIAPIEDAISLRREVYQQYRSLTDAQRWDFRGKLITKILHRAHLLSLERDSKIDNKLPEMLTT